MCVEKYDAGVSFGSRVDRDAVIVRLMDKDLRQRGSPDLWLDAAYAALVSGGVEAVRVMPLAQALGVSRTSFYWHFADREALLAALVARWQGQNTGNLIARTEAYAETITEAVLNLCDCWITPELFDSRLEFAMRNWANSAPHLADVFAATDARRMEALRAMFARFHYEEAQADIRARVIYLTQVGYISMKTDESAAERVRRVPSYVEAFTGLAPREAEIARFLARHQDKL